MEQALIGIALGWLIYRLCDPFGWSEWLIARGIRLWLQVHGVGR